MKELAQHEADEHIRDAMEIVRKLAENAHAAKRRRELHDSKKAMVSALSEPDQIIVVGLGEILFFEEATSVYSSGSKKAKVQYVTNFYCGRRSQFLSGFSIRMSSLTECCRSARKNNSRGISSPRCAIRKNSPLPALSSLSISNAFEIQSRPRCKVILSWSAVSNFTEGILVDVVELAATNPERERTLQILWELGDEAQNTYVILTTEAQRDAWLKALKDLYQKTGRPQRFRELRRRQKLQGTTLMLKPTKQRLTVFRGNGTMQ